MSAPRWTVDYAGEWPHPLGCFVLQLLTLGLAGHAWRVLPASDGELVDENGFEMAECLRCGAVRSRRWVHRVELPGGGVGTFTGMEPPTADDLEALSALRDAAIAMQEPRP